MDRLLLLILGVVGSVCRSRADLVLENAALRHQLGVLMRAGRRPPVTAADRWFWVVLRRFWARWTPGDRVWTVVGRLDTRSRHADRVMAKDRA